MIEKLAVKDVEELERNFPLVFLKDRVLKDINNNSFTKYFVYKIDNKIVACINYQVMYERSELIDVNVLEDYQNKGIASKLLEFMFKDLRNNNVENITLEVRKNNENAIYLYKKYGFIQIGIRKNYYKGIDGILMKKELM